MHRTICTLFEYSNRFARIITAPRCDLLLAKVNVEKTMRNGEREREKENRGILVTTMLIEGLTADSKSRFSNLEILHANVIEVKRLNG